MTVAILCANPDDNVNVTLDKVGEVRWERTLGRGASEMGALFHNDNHIPSGENKHNLKKKKEKKERGNPSMNSWLVSSVNWQTDYACQCLLIIRLFGLIGVIRDLKGAFCHCYWRH